MKRISQLLVLTVAAVLGLAPVASLAQRTNIPQYFRPYDQRGVNMFEEPREDAREFEGFEVYLGGAFAQQFQSLSHSNENVGDSLLSIGAGFNLATANLILDAQLADGVRLNLVSYLSSRHHNETWVKGGYVQVDKVSFLGSALLDKVFEHARVKMGHFEINYGDTHFRRSDNGNAIWNPFVGEYLMDAFTTEIGGEVYVFAGDFFGLGGVTGGEIKGDVTDPEGRSPSIYGKLGYDSQVSDDLRLRLTGSVFTKEKSHSSTLYAGDRAGSRYYSVLMRTGASDDFRAGRVNPGFSDHVTAIQINPFVKFRGVELFGVYETATGGVDAEGVNGVEDRTWSQIGVEGLFRFLPREQAYVGARYNTASGRLGGMADDVTVNRIQIGGGWFATPNLLLKAEYVTQTYDGYPVGHILNGGEFNGLVIEGVLAF
jgi:hypothetical protein